MTLRLLRPIAIHSTQRLRTISTSIPVIPAAQLTLSPSTARNPNLTNPQGHHRTYASKPKSTATLTPGSQQPLTSETSRLEYARAQEKMQTALEWFRYECTAVETRAGGRVMASLLDPVRVYLPGGAGSANLKSPSPPPGPAHVTVRLEELATVGVKDGSTLVVTVFEEHALKHVEAAIYDAKIPGIVPQRQDSRTIKIPISRPTVETRAALYTSAQRKAEDTREQIRKFHQASVKRGKFAKHSVELGEFQKLADRCIGEVDKMLVQLKKATGVR